MTSHSRLISLDSFDDSPFQRLTTTRISPLTFTHDLAILCSFPGMDEPDPFFLSINARRLLSIATKDVCRRVLAILTAYTFVSDPCRVGCKSPYFHGLFDELLLHPHSSYPLLNSEVHVESTYLWTFSYYSSQCTTQEPIHQVHLTVLNSFCTSLLLFLLSCS